MISDLVLLVLHIWRISFHQLPISRSRAGLELDPIISQIASFLLAFL